jgi:hypothetical protein
MGAGVVKRRHGLPSGWRIIPGGVVQPSSGESLKSATRGGVPGAPARQEYDPVIEQTRSIARQLFASELAAHYGVRRDPVAARLAWIASSSRRGDGGMVNILERIDPDTFAETWTQLVFSLEQRGARGMLEWLESERGT